MEIIKIIKNYKFVILFIIVAIVIAGFVSYKKYVQKNVNQEVQDNKKQEMIVLDYDDYMKKGFEYKTAGDFGDMSAYLKALEMYKKATEISPSDKKWIPLFNVGNIYKDTKEYENAEIYYNKSIEADQTQWVVYSAKIELYRYNLKKSNNNVLTVYQAAFDKASDNLNITVSYAGYLRDIGDYSGSLKYFEQLSEKYPDDQTFKNEIIWLKSKP